MPGFEFRLSKLFRDKYAHFLDLILIGCAHQLHCLARDPGLKIHMYGKPVKPGRKIGHVTVLGTDLPDCVERARHAAGYLCGEIDE